MGNVACTGTRIRPDRARWGSTWASTAAATAAFSSRTGPATSRPDPRPTMHQGHEVDLGPRPAPTPDHHDPSADGQGAEHAGQARGTHQFQHHVEGTEFQRLVGSHRLGRSEVRHRLVPLGGPHRRHHRGPGHGGQLHPGRPHPAGGGRHEHPVTHGQSALGEQRVVGGGEHLGEAAGLIPRESVGNGQGTAFVDHGHLGLGPSSHHTHDAITDGEARCPRPEGHHFPSHLESGNVSRHSRRRRIEAPSLQEVGGVDAGGPDGHHDLGVAGHGIAPLDPLKLTFDDGDRPHAAAR
jgi:hypothetical protein